MFMSKFTHTRLGLRIAFVVLIAALTLGATTDTSSRFNDLGHRLMCTCGCGQVLLECNHVGCTASESMRRELTAGLQRGDNDDQILNWFVQKYGAVVLAAPAKTGFGRVAWLMPYLSLLAGLVLTALIIRLWRSRSQAAPAASISRMNPAALESMRRRVHEETEL
jgi:cytochrome c-type biogenesis protein CcmH